MPEVSCTGNIESYDGDIEPPLPLPPSDMAESTSQCCPAVATQTTTVAGADMAKAFALVFVAGVIFGGATVWYLTAED